MISCTEFIPAYSELFTFLDNKYGREEVSRLWEFLFKPTGDGIPLINYARKDGLKGCIDYWDKTLSEEAAERIRYSNVEEGWSYSIMYYCPSKGRLLELEKEIGLKPYYDYCAHCDYYRAALDEVDLKWIRNHIDVDKACCSSILYDPQKFKGMLTLNENTKIVRTKASDNEYFHPDFHSSMNMGIEYVGMTHGTQDVIDYLVMYTNDVYKPVFDVMKSDPLGAIEAKIRETYRLEKAGDALQIEKDENTLRVKVLYCPAVKHLKETGRTVSSWFGLTTQIVMKTLAARAGLVFSMDAYDHETGAAAYSFTG